MKNFAFNGTIRIKKVERLFCKMVDPNKKPDVKKKQYKREIYRPYTRRKEES